MTLPTPPRLLIAAALLAAVAVGYYVKHRPVGAAPSRGGGSVSVAAAPVERTAFPLTLSTVGTIRPWQSVIVRARVDGEIKALHFTEGQMVKAGDLLVEIDSRAIEASVAQTKADRQNFEAQLRQAQLDLDRAKRLAAGGNTSAQTVDQLEARVEQLRAQVAGAEAQVKAAEVQLDYTRITAPIDGRIGLRRVDAGNIVRASDSEGILTINQIDPIAVVLTLPQQDLPRLQAALAQSESLPVSVRTDVNGADIATGRLSTLDNQIDPDTGTVAIKAMLPNEGQKLWPGQAVMVRVTLEILADALTVPLAAVQRGPESSFVYVIREGKAALVPVEVQHRSDTRAVVRGELMADEQVVTDGQLRLKPGSAVQARDSAQAANAAP